jgi:formimidoylglutamate deiminase
MSVAGCYEVEHLHQPSGWLSPGYLEVGANGLVVAVHQTRPETVPVIRLAGFGVPGAPNLHSHAFQRALAGFSESATISEDTLWTWRDVMYRFVARIDPARYQAIAAMVYMEMLKHGITAVGEFHYVHHDPAGAPYADRAEMSKRLIAAAARTGIALTLLPVLYASGGVGKPPQQSQMRFVHREPDRFLDLVATLRGLRAENPGLEIGAALHSLRAVPAGSIATVTAAVGEMAAGMPIHIHVAEQTREVEECVAGLGARPVQWLLDNTSVGQGWTLVHATHCDPQERRGMAACGAVVGLCPATEASLGDGIFPLVAYQGEGGHWGVGTDSNYTANFAEELRVLEYGQRLSHGQRNLLAQAGDETTAHTGRRLFDLALAGGVRSLAQPMGGLIPGRRADLVLLHADSPTLLGHGPRTVLDAWILGGTVNPVREVMVGGRWVIRDGRHDGEDTIIAAYKDSMAQASASA